MADECETFFVDQKKENEGGRWELQPACSMRCCQQEEERARRRRPGVRQEEIFFAKMADSTIMVGDDGEKANSRPQSKVIIDSVLLDAMNQPRARALVLKIEAAILKFMKAPM